MSSTIFQEIIEQELALIKELLSKIDSKNEGHLKGTAFELRLKNLFSKMIPSFCSISNGWIIDKKGKKSDERDLLIYNKDKAPQFLFDIGTGIFPLESIEYDIQVKNSISDGNFKQAYEKFDERIERNVLLGIKGSKLFEKYSKIDSNYLIKPKICAFASEEDKYYFFNKEKMKYKKLLNFNKLQQDNGSIINVNGNSKNITINGHNLSDIEEKEITICRWFSIDLKPQSNLLGFFNGFINTLFKIKTGKYFCDLSKNHFECLSFVVLDDNNKQIFQASSENLKATFSFETSVKFLEDGDITLSIKQADNKYENNDKSQDNNIIEKFKQTHTIK